VQLLYITVYSSIYFSSWFCYRNTVLDKDKTCVC